MKKYIHQIKSAIHKKVAHFSGYLKVGLGGLTLLLMVAFAESRYEARAIKQVDIRVASPHEHHFVQHKDVRYMLRDQFNTPLKRKKQGIIDLAAMEEAFEQNRFVRQAEVYNDLEGILTIQIGQRNPVLRVMNENGKSFYLDETGAKMPTSLQYTAPVLTASGAIKSSAEQLDSITNPTINDLYTITQHIIRDSFLNALVGGIKVRQNQEFQLIPRVGKQEIVLGEAQNLPGRFSKLKAFYRKVLPYEGWHKYERINLKFKQQIVAKK